MGDILLGDICNLIYPEKKDDSCGISYALASLYNLYIV